jgi:hypothetical protein
MESDYGFDYLPDFTEEAFDPVYQGYKSYEFGDDEDDDIHFHEDDIWLIEEENAYDYQIGMKRSRHDHDSESKKSKKKKRKKLLKESPTEQYYGTILGWTIELLQQNDRSALGLPALPILPVSFDSRSSYYEHHKAISLEETRAYLTNTLRANHSNQIEITCKLAFDVSCGRLTSINFKISAGSLEYSRPGNLFLLECRKLPSQVTLATVSQSGSSHSMNLADKKSLSLWVSSDWLRARQHIVTKVEVEWIARPLETFISYQRMYTVCVEEPYPVFMRNLLGKSTLPSSHIIFIDDSDNEKITVADGALPDDDSDILEVTVIKTKEDIQPSSKEEGFNKSQKTAYESCLQSLENEETGSLQLIHGPPGCGKTYFLSQLVSGILSRGMHVLACAPSNKAICVALEAFLSSDLSTTSELKIALVGVEDKIEFCSSTDPRSAAFNLNSISALFPDVILSFSSGRSLTVYEPFPLLPEYLTDATERLICPRAAQDLLVYKYSAHLVAAAEAISRFITQLSKLIKQRWSIWSRQELFLRTVGVFTSEVKLVMKKLVPIALETANKADNDFAGWSEIQLSTAIEQLTTIVQAQCLSEQILANIDEYLFQLQDVLCSFDQIAQQKKYSEMVAEVLVSTSQAVFSTLTGVGHSIMRRNIGEIDVLICDEASQALESEVLIALKVLPTHLILIGDPMQLPATTFSSDVQARGLNTSMMERLLKHTSATCHLLATQYRMHPEISSFPNKTFYQGRLENAAHLMTRSYPLYTPNIMANLPDFMRCYSMIDLPGKELFDRSNSAYNPQEATFIASLAQYLASKYHFIRSSGTPSASISIISFYSAQVTEIRRALQRYDLRSPSVRVMTVDSFQGSECDIVILSFTRANTRGNIGFLADVRRLNVALTRAKHLLIGVGSMDTFSNSSATKNECIQDLVQDARNRGRIFKSVDIEPYFR